MSQAFVTIGDLLKDEASTGNRVDIPAPTGLKAGELVEYTPRGQYLVALTDETFGKTLVQPVNCVIFADNISEDSLAAYELTVQQLADQGEAHGIKYISLTKDIVPAPAGTTSTTTGTTTGTTTP